ncbi:MAG: peptidase MA family metallohydrolase [Alphaproteobacteria bacterium]
MAILWPACSGAQQLKNVFETPVARIHSNGEHEELVKTTGEALEFARRSLGNPAGFPPKKIEVYIYNSEPQMAEGVTTTLGYRRENAQLVAKVGFSALTSNTLHINSRAEKWGLLFWHVVVHEYSHGIAEERYGMVLPNSARWLYEGLGEVEANRALSRKFAAFEEAYARSRFKVAFKALLFFKLFQFKNILAQDDWLANIANSRERWDIQYAQAYTAVSYLITNYGFDKFNALLTDIKNGRSVEEAMDKVFGLSPLRFEIQYYWFMLRMGLFGFYVRYTVALAVIVLLLSVAVLLMLKWRRGS